MTDALEDHEGTVSIRGNKITNLRFADDIGGLAGEEEELANVAERLDKVSTACGMEISAEKTKLMTNKTSGANKEIKVNGQLIWSISLSSKIRLMRSLDTSIFLYACESWTLSAELQRRIQAMKMRCYRKILHISYKDHVTNEEVGAKIQQVLGPHEDS